MFSLLTLNKLKHKNIFFKRKKTVEWNFHVKCLGSNETSAPVSKHSQIWKILLVDGNLKKSNSNVEVRFHLSVHMPF